jgi:hypothetical protein
MGKPYTNPMSKNGQSQRAHRVVPTYLPHVDPKLCLSYLLDFRLQPHFETGLGI